MDNIHSNLARFNINWHEQNILGNYIVQNVAPPQEICQNPYYGMHKLLPNYPSVLSIKNTSASAYTRSHIAKSETNCNFHPHTQSWQYVTYWYSTRMMQTTVSVSWLRCVTAIAFHAPYQLWHANNVISRNTSQVTLKLRHIPNKEKLIRRLRILNYITANVTRMNATKYTT